MPAGHSAGAAGLRLPGGPELAQQGAGSERPAWLLPEPPGAQAARSDGELVQQLQGVRPVRWGEGSGLVPPDVARGLPAWRQQREPRAWRASPELPV